MGGGGAHARWGWGGGERARYVCGVWGWGGGKGRARGGKVQARFFVYSLFV